MVGLSPPRLKGPKLNRWTLGRRKLKLGREGTQESSGQSVLCEADCSLLLRALQALQPQDQLVSWGIQVQAEGCVQQNSRALLTAASGQAQALKQLLTYPYSSNLRVVVSIGRSPWDLAPIWAD